MDEDLFGDGTKYEARFTQIYAQTEFRAEQVRATARPCAACGKSMLDWPGRTVHFSCDPDTLAGKMCTCPRECSASAWGNGPVACDPGCVPCARMRGIAFAKKRGG